MLERLRLTSFKGFANFTVHFGNGAMLVGPNNAGKSTIISALKLCAAAGRLAMRRAPSERFWDKGVQVLGYQLSSVAGSGFVDENVRHEFRDQESRLDLKYKSGGGLHVVWPVGDALPFVYVSSPTGQFVLKPALAREILVPIGVVPALA